MYSTLRRRFAWTDCLALHGSRFALSHSISHFVLCYHFEFLSHSMQFPFQLNLMALPFCGEVLPFFVLNFCFFYMKCIILFSQIRAPYKPHGPKSFFNDKIWIFFVSITFIQSTYATYAGRTCIPFLHNRGKQRLVNLKQPNERTNKFTFKYLM